MNKSLQDVYHYHNETKHSPMRYARSLGYMDWSTQPNPYRSYKGSEKFPLRISLENATPSYADIFKEVPAAPLCYEAISQLMQFSLAKTATKTFQGNSWDLRANASSGNLHPTEAYLILPAMPNLGDKSKLYHYSAKEHHLEALATIEDGALRQDEFILVLSSIYWREAWKYGERAFRYVSLDTGHALRAVEISAKTLGWDLQRITLANETLNAMTGLDQLERFHAIEREDAEIVLLFSQRKEVDTEAIIESVKNTQLPHANILSHSHHPWDIIFSVADATKSIEQPLQRDRSQEPTRLQNITAKEVILKRRSAQMMNPERSHITFESFSNILTATALNILSHQNFVHLVYYLHNVEGLEAGLYLHVRDNSAFTNLQNQMKESFLFRPVKGIENFYLLALGDFRSFAKSCSCNQDIASDSAFAISMLATLEPTLSKYGAHAYKELYYECGAIGQQLYLEATANGLSATGIGCFLDDVIHRFLGLESNHFQVLYNFTIGRAIKDTRLVDIAPYT